MDEAEAVALGDTMGSASKGRPWRASLYAAIHLPWSNGQTEGQITKLKLVKRQMYARGKLDLLQARMLAAS
jgi:transposase